ncbi:MAG: glycosyl hydrolase 108 family protein [Rhodomicrobium sp.]
MASGNFERCLAVTLKWEGGYSNHPDDPGGPTMKGITQREYDAWRKRQGKRGRPVRQIGDDEVETIYRENYWDAMHCEGFPLGTDLCVFDAAVNSGVGRAQEWCDQAQGIDQLCDARLAYLQRLGRLWRVFGAGWRRRVDGIRRTAQLIARNIASEQAEETGLHAGMKGKTVRSLQEKLRALGYPCGSVDGIYGQQLYRAVVLFQEDHELTGERGVWTPAYDEILANSGPMLPRRKELTHRDLEEAGDVQVKHMNLLQRASAWLLGVGAAGETFQSDGVMDSLNGVRNVVEPVQGIFDWVSGNRFLLLCAACAAIIALIRLLRREHVKAYQNFDYQGPATTKEAPQ